MLRALAMFGIVCGLAAGGARADTAYRVVPGDTLTALAQRYGTTVESLARLNGLSSTSMLLTGSTLRLPAPRPQEQRYVIQPGDTLTSIAERFRTTPPAIARASGITTEQPIVIGHVLRVPVVAQVGTAAGITLYRVRVGDTLSGIAFQHGVSLGVLADLNHLDVAAPLLADTTIALPAGNLPEATASFVGSSVRDSIRSWAAHYGVNAHLVAALAWMESGFNNTLVSSAGAEGVMQLTPDTWDYVQGVLLLGQSVPHTSDGNVRVGVAYLHHLLNLFGGSERRALAAYYQGARSLQEEGFLPGTKQYVDDILALKKRF